MMGKGGEKKELGLLRHKSEFLCGLGPFAQTPPEAAKPGQGELSTNSLCCSSQSFLFNILMSVHRLQNSVFSTSRNTQTFQVSGLCLSKGDSSKPLLFQASWPYQLRLFAVI